MVPGGAQHLLEGRAVQVAAGEALVLEDEGGAGSFPAGVQADIFAAEVDLVGSTFAFAGEFGFAGVDGGGGHSGGSFGDVLSNYIASITDTKGKATIYK